MARLHSETAWAVKVMQKRGIVCAGFVGTGYGVDGPPLLGDTKKSVLAAAALLPLGTLWRHVGARVRITEIKLAPKRRK